MKRALKTICFKKILPRSLSINQNVFVLLKITFVGVVSNKWFYL